MSDIKYFLDTEFIEDGKTVDLISLALVCEDGRSLYRQNLDCNFKKASDWVWRNVFPFLKHFDMRGERSCYPRRETYDSGLGTRIYSTCSSKLEDQCSWATRNEIRDAILEFCAVEKYGKPEFWGYYADYDWVVFCQLFGTMGDLPKGFPMYCCDIKQLLDQKGCVEAPKNYFEHNALSDALWNKEIYYKIR